MKMNKKRYIVIFIILAIYAFLMYWFIGRDNIKQESYTSTILVGDNTVWNYSNKKWMNITTSSTIKKLNWKKFTVYIDNKKVGRLYLWHDDKWYLFDDEKNAIATTGNMLAYRSNHQLKVKDFTSENNTDATYVNKVLEDNGFSTSSQFTVNTVANVDIDSDGIEERFFTISNVFSTEFFPDKLFSIVFMVKDDQIYYIYNSEDDNRTNNGCKPYLNSFIDINSDNNYELILSCGRYSVSETVQMLYKYTDEGFKMVISNQ